MLPARTEITFNWLYSVWATNSIDSNGKWTFAETTMNCKNYICILYTLCHMYSMLWYIMYAHLLQSILFRYAIPMWWCFQIKIVKLRNVQIHFESNTSSPHSTSVFFVCFLNILKAKTDSETNRFKQIVTQVPIYLVNAHSRILPAEKKSFV